MPGMKNIRVPHFPLRSVLLLIVLAQVGLMGGELRYQSVRVWYQSDTQLQQIFALGLDNEGARVKHNTFIEGVVPESVVPDLESAGFRVEILQNDLAQAYETQLRHDPPSREFGQGSMGGYYTYDEISVLLDSLHASHPEIVSAKFSIGQSYQGRDLWAVKISDNVDLDEAEPEVFYNSLIHAREPAAMMAVLYYAFQLADHYVTNPEYQYLVDHREMWFVPVINPDGYVYNEMNHPNGGGMHRKNLSPGCIDPPGTDLNRNFGYNWGFDNSGSSPSSCSETFRGLEAFSEPETQALRDFVLSRNFTTVFNYHTYSDLLIMPFGYTADAVPTEPDYSIYMELGQDLIADNGYLFGTGMQTVGYLTNGDAVDWMYGSQGIINFTPEVGGYGDGGFWPSASQISGLETENLGANIHLALVAGNDLEFEQIELVGADEFLLPSMEYGLSVAIRNKGFQSSPGTSQTIHLYSPDHSLSLNDTLIQLGPIASLTTMNVIDDASGIFVNATYGQTATLIAEIGVTADYSRSDTISWIVGAPDTLYFNGAETGMAGWQSDSWGTTSDAFAGDFAFTESPFGNYPSNASLTMTQLSGIDISQCMNPVLSFDAKWDIETDWDFAQILVSPDGGSSWQPLAGQYTHPGNGESAQPLGEPGYDGQQTQWISEYIDLSRFSTSTDFRLGFRLTSDNYVNGNGFVVDNITLLGWSEFLMEGDVNADGVVNIQDVLMLVEGILQTNPLTEQQLTASDINHDGILNILDLVILIDAILQLN